MRLLELFSGTESMSKVFRERGHTCITVDNDPQFNPSLVEDVIELGRFPMYLEEVIGNFDAIWASPPCEAFSVASIGHHWTGGKCAYVPKTEHAEHSMELVLATLVIIDQLKPRYWFIENPRGVLRKLYFMKDIPRKTITYCQYGDTRMKPTDIFGTVDEFEFKPMCHNGDTCHTPAPRGAKTGTQGLKGAVARAVIPCEFCLNLCRQIETKLE